jgi:hypothetical protein
LEKKAGERTRRQVRPQYKYKVQAQTGIEERQAVLPKGYADRNLAIHRAGMVHRYL